MKPRKELKAGDWVKFFGYTSEGFCGIYVEWCEVLTQEKGLVLINYESESQYIHRNQVYRVKRKVKKKKNYVWIKTTACSHNDDGEPSGYFLETTLSDMSHNPEWTKFVEVKNGK